MAAAVAPPAAPRPADGPAAPPPATPAPTAAGSRGADADGGAGDSGSGDAGIGIPDATQQQLASALGVPAAVTVNLRAPVLGGTDVVPQLLSALPLDRRVGGLVQATAETPLELSAPGAAGALRGVAVSADQLQRALRSPTFVEEMDRAREQIRAEFNLDRTVAVSAAGVGFGASVIYVLWLIRGGVLMGSYLSALPAWRVLDPLPVLSQAGGGAAGDDPDDDALAEGPSAGDPLASLRGY